MWRIRYRRKNDRYFPLAYEWLTMYDYNAENVPRFDQMSHDLAVITVDYVIE